MRAHTAVIPLMENSKEISVLNATKRIGNVLNADFSSRLRRRRIHARNAMKSAIFLMLPAIPRNAEVPEISIRGYRKNPGFWDFRDRFPGEIGRS
jgi:hypothetical protein